MEFKNTLHKLTPAISMVLFAVAVFVVHREIEAYRWQDIRHAMESLPASLMTLCGFLALAGYVALSFYDYLALEYAGEKLPYRRVLFTSFLSYAFSNNVGHAWLSGGSMRYRLYSGWGMPGMSIAKVVLFCAASYFLGAVTLMVAGYALSPDQALITDRVPANVLRAAILTGTLLLVAWWSLVAVCRRPVTIYQFSVSVPRFSLALRQLLAALLDLLLASLVMYFPLSYFTDTPFGDFLVLYIFAQLAGLFSMVPGGIGVFEGSFVFLAPVHYPVPHIIAALIVYRAVYYFMPLVLASFMLAAYELRLYRLMRHRLVVAAISVIESAIPQIFSVMLMLGGGVLLFSGATPALKERLGWVEYLIPLPAMELSHLLGSVAGVALLLLSQAVRQRIDAAYFASVAMLALGMIASLGKGLDYEEAVFLGMVLVLLIPVRKHFYRKSALLQLEFSSQWIVLAAIAVLGSTWLGFFSYKHVEYSNELWWQFALHGDASRFLRSLVAVLVIVSAFAGYRLLTRTAFSLVLPDRAELDRAAAVVRQANDTSSYLALTGDKFLLWSRSGKSFVMFAVTDRFWVAMGDPVGVADEYEDLAWELRTQADRHNAKLVFYQVSALRIPVYLDLGLTLLKLGEEARVPLASFSLEGTRRAGLRHAFNRVQREGVSFEIVPPSGVSAVLPELQSISDHWLEHKKAREKRFSIGFFDGEYLRRCTVALVRKEGRIIAFANLWELENRNELSIDLMRYEPGAGNGLMEYLIISLLLWGKEQGYCWFNLGMAPLFGLEQHPLAPLWNKIGNTIFRFGNEFYNFDGLYQYKNKFDPEWQPRYLAAPAGLSTVSALLSVTTLISGKLERRIFKMNKLLVVVAALLSLITGQSFAADVQETTDHFGPFGTLHLYTASAQPKHLTLFISGDGGWNLGVVDMARLLAGLDSMVVGIDITHYIKQLDASGEKCAYSAAHFEELSQYLQKKYRFPHYTLPVLAGYSSGATLVYAVLAQAPPNTFAGGISMGFCPDLKTARPLCKGNGAMTGKHDPKLGYVYSPVPALASKLYVLQGDIDQVCSTPDTRVYLSKIENAELIELANVGHGFSVQRNWMPQFKQAFEKLAVVQQQAAPATPVVEELSDLPLAELPAAVRSDTLAVIISGDGGWAGIDRQVAEALNNKGIGVVGLNSLQYFWLKKTPDVAGADLTRILNHYRAAWNAGKFILIGYSTGADTLPFMVSRLSAEIKSRVKLVALLGPGQEASFEFHVSEWLFEADGLFKVVPEVNKLNATNVLCVYGEDESDSACRLLDSRSFAVVEMKGGHHFSGDYQELANIILRHSR